MRFLIAALGLGWVLWVAARRRAGRPLSQAISHGVLGGIALAAWASWFDFGLVQDIGGVHRHDVFHYYVGAKYHRELGYELLYRCAAVAEAEDGRLAEVRQRSLRDLRTLRVVPAEQALSEPEVCHARFSPERWSSFRQDVHNFRSAMPEQGWRASQTDHGYNPSPAWSASSGMLARVFPSTSIGLRLLASVDIVLVGAAVAALYAAFGFRVAAIALILWGTQEPAKMSWIGFSMLRVDWCFALAASVALLRRNRPALAGGALGWAIATRVFPAIGLAGVVLAGLAWPSLRKRFMRVRLRFAAGCIAMVACMVALGAIAAGPSSWTDWAGRMRQYVAYVATNDIGLDVVLGYDPAHRVESIQARDPTAPEEQWKAQLGDELVQLRSDRRLPILLVRLAFGVLLVLALARTRRPWLGLVLALLAAPMVSTLPNYYLAFFMLAAVLIAARAAIERWLLAFAAGLQLLMVMPAVAYYSDDRHLALSIGYLGIALALLVTVGLRPRPAGRTGLR
jgi:hypothetical protein